MKMIDLRSDTVTKPSPNMLDAMFAAQVGDDVFEEDPEVNKLEALAATMFGFEKSLFCPSGTMTNQIAIKVHTQPGEGLICHKLSHIYNYEGGGIAFNSGVSAQLIEGENGIISPLDIIANINGDDLYSAKTSLVVVENSCNKAGGIIYTVQNLTEISNVCRQHKLALHLDGARIFNALSASGNQPIELANVFDSASVCLSKGLGCPVGSLLLGSSDFIKKARKVRKVFGGGMRQAGFLAAAGSYALVHNIKRLAEDHVRAKWLARDLENLPWIESILPVYTNIIVAKIPIAFNTKTIVEKLKQYNILVVPFGAGKIRLVTHLDITDGDVEIACNVFKKIKF